MSDELTDAVKKSKEIFFLPRYEKGTPCSNVMQQWLSVCFRYSASYAAL